MTLLKQMYEIIFSKMHGLGNDFVIVDQNHLPGNYNVRLLAIEISNRKTGIGCDQFIIYNKLDNVTKDKYEMIIYNQDGSLAEICGNAARCLTSLIKKNTGSREINIVAGAREIMCKSLGNDITSINMGKVEFDKNWMPKDEQLWEIARIYGIEPKEMICADVGNPHLIIFSDLSFKDRGVIGARMQEHKLFPGGINVNFAQIIDNEIRLIVWERGAGFTLSCGSGASATFASAIKLGFIENHAQISFELGSLEMNIDKDQNIIMVGPSSFIADGEFYVN